MRVIIALVQVGELKFCVVENVKGILAPENGNKNKDTFMQKLLVQLRKEAQEFCWDVTVLRAADYMLPQKRERVFLRGIRCSLAATVPAPLAPFGSKPLVDFLTPRLAPVDRTALTANMRQNLLDAEADLKKEIGQGKLEEDDIVVFPLDRANGKVFQRTYSKNIIPTLTCTNRYLFLASCDLKTKTDAQRAFFRFLTCDERMALQGFSPQTLQGCTEALRFKASGNAYPVPLMLAVLHPLLRSLGLPGALREATGLPSPSLDTAAPALERFERGMQPKRGSAKAGTKKKGTKKAGSAKKAKETKKAKAKQQKKLKRPAAARKKPACGRQTAEQPAAEAPPRKCLGLCMVFCLVHRARARLWFQISKPPRPATWTLQVQTLYKP
jgi:site-specific DNA-cytosine methylase